MGLTASNNGSDFEMAPEGVHVARCFKMIDLGTQESEYQGKKKKAHKILFSWELLGEERMEDGQPFSVSTRYTASLHEKSTLRKALEAWRGRKFTPEEEALFDLTKVLGALCMLNIVHETRDGKDYANIASIMPLPKGMPKPDGVNGLVVFDLDDPDMQMFDTFGEKLKATIMSSPEWKNRKAGGDSDRSTGIDEMPEDIPF